jgi:hypothetical protein
MKYHDECRGKFVIDLYVHNYCGYLRRKKGTRANWWACILAGTYYYFLAWVRNLVEVGLFLWLSSTTRGDAYVFLVPVGILSLHRVLIGATVEVRFLRRIASTLSNCKPSILSFNWFCLSARETWICLYLLVGTYDPFVNVIFIQAVRYPCISLGQWSRSLSWT